MNTHDYIAPTWVVSVVAWDGTGEIDEWTEVITTPGLNRRDAIAQAIEGLPGDASDPLIQRMIAYHGGDTWRVTKRLAY